MKMFKFSLHLSVQEMEKYYSGYAKVVYVRGVDGQSIQFPASILQPFITHNGIHGLFNLKVDANNKFVELVRVDDSE